MPAQSLDDTSWDFSPVYALIQSLSEKERAAGVGPDETVTNDTPSFAQHGGVTLGDFNNIWDYLGVSRKPPAPSVPTFESATAKKNRIGKDDAYASDGAAHYNRSSKSVKWRDETDGGDIADTQAEDTSPAEVDDEGLTKNQRKKRNRKLRKAAEREQMAANLTPKKAEAAGSGDESDSLPQAISIKSPPAIRTNGVIGSYPPSTPSKSPVPRFNHATLRDSMFRPMQVAPPKNIPQKENTKIHGGYLSEQISTARDMVAASVRKPPQTPDRPIAKTLPQSLQSKHTGDRPSNTRMQSEPPDIAPPTLLKSKVKQDNENDGKTLSAAEILNQKLKDTLPSKPHYGPNIQPLIHHSSADRNWSLLLKLLNAFPENRDSLLSPLQLSYNHPVPYGIHVFVDASNILIGFMDHLKRARNIPENVRVPRVYPSFHALALLLERRRPVAKRVLAGSTPHVPAFDEAKQIGYDCSILDKVWKARELTERQRRYAVRAANGGAGGGSHSGYGSDSGGGLSDSVPHHQQPKWVEQGVDEVLHLKMLESILDTPTAAHDASKAGSCARPTLVLATGDAAEAEYSSGFRRMVERALAHGWNAEVMAWGASINHDWRKMERRSAFKGRMRIIELDDFVEELFSDA